MSGQWDAPDPVAAHTAGVVLIEEEDKQNLPPGQPPKLTATDHRLSELSK